MAVTREEMLASAEAITENVALRLVLEGLMRLESHIQPVVVPPPIVTIAPPDLSAIVTAVNGLKPGADADDIARAIQRVILPSPALGPDPATEAILEALKKLDFRMQGQVPAFGASGPSNISDNANRLLGIVTVNPIGPIPNTTRLLDYDVRTDANPVYIGQAPQGQPTSAPVWQVQKLSYDGTARLTEQEYLSGVIWDNRTTLGW